MIRVALHAVAGPRGGPRTYAVALARALARRRELDLVVLTDRPEVFQEIPCVRLKGPRPFVDQFVVPRLLQRLVPDVYHNTKNALPLFAPRRSVVTVHDLACWHFPETFSLPARLYLRAHTRHAVRRATRVIAVSDHARRDLVATLGAPEQKLRVIHHGVDEAFRAPAPLPRLDLPGPYVLSVGTIQARKNLEVLVRAVALLRRRDGIEVTLAIAGRRGWKTRAFDEACRDTPVRLLGAVPDEALPALYAGAAAFVQPSSYEGFGLTAAEAMASGAPVVAADAGSLPEVVGDAALLVPPRNAEALAAALKQLLDRDGPARALREAGRARARRFTWEASAAAHAAVYAEAASC
ncbi:MAG: glycosyltransferase family 4 protein [Planctomycetaceae bacterium]